MFKEIPQNGIPLTPCAWAAEKNGDYSCFEHIEWQEHEGNVYSCHKQTRQCRKAASNRSTTIDATDCCFGYELLDSLTSEKECF